MDFADSVSDGAKYLSRSDDWIRTVLIGGVLSLLGFLIVPSILVVGYAMRAIRAGVADAEPPVFDDWGDLFWDGLKGSVIGIVYGLVPAIVVFGITALLGGGLFAADTAGVGVAVILLGTLVAIVVWLAAAYVVPAALANYATDEDRRLGSGFAFGDIWDVLTSGTYAVGWLAAVVLLVLASVVVGLLSIVPIIGSIAGVFVWFYVAVGADFVIGRTWAEVHALAPEAGDETGIEDEEQSPA